MTAWAAGALRHRVERWLLGVWAPEAAPIVLGRRRIYVFPTPAGFAFAAAILVMLVASVNYGLGLGYALVFLLSGTAFTSIIHAFRNLLNLSVRPGRIEPVFAGETAQFRLLIDNSGRLRRPALRLRARGVERRFDAAEHETAEVVLAHAAAGRGRLPLGRVVLETAYPLGLIRAWSILVPDMECLVYPAPERQPPPLPDSAALRPGRRTGRTQSGDEDFAGLRARQLADSPRHVAWKVVARGGPMLTKQFSGLDGAHGELDWQCLPAELGTEARLSRLAAWVLAADAAGIAFRLHLPDGSSAIGSGPRHVADCLKRLALFGMESRNDA